MSKLSKRFVEVCQARNISGTFVDVGRMRGNLNHPIKESFWENVVKDIDFHGSSIEMGLSLTPPHSLCRSPLAKTNDEVPDFFITAVFGLIILAMMNHLNPLSD